MSQNDGQAIPERNWPEVREWAGLAIAVAALLVGIVSIWTTAQISGLEDYLRSEISRRNVELDDAAFAARQLDERVLRSENRLADLRLTADRLSVSSSEAQIKLSDAQARSLELLSEQRRSEAALIMSREDLARISEEVDEQEKTLAEFRSQEVLASFYSNLRFSVYAGLLQNDTEVMANSVSGPFYLSEMRNFGISVTDPETAGYYESVRTVGVALCRSLASYEPSFPALLENPSLGPRPGRRTDRGTVLMTNREAAEWNGRVAEWSAEWDRVGAHNRAVREMRRATSEYLRSAVQRCACIAVTKNTTSCPDAAARPDLDELYSATVGQLRD